MGLGYVYQKSLKNQNSSDKHDPAFMQDKTCPLLYIIVHNYTIIYTGQVTTIIKKILR